MAGVIFASQIGAHFTAELGAMRISDEIDALEVMGVDSFQYLVATRVWAALITMVPLYLAALFASYLATELIVTQFFALGTGQYRHYFNLFLLGWPILQWNPPVHVHGPGPAGGAGALPADDAARFASALGHLLDDPEERRRMGEAGRRTALEHYAWPRVATKLEAYYDDLLAGVRPAWASATSSFAS